MSWVSGVLYRLYAFKYGRLRRFILAAVSKLEGGKMVSCTLRRIFADYHDREVGLYSYGSCFDTYAIDEGVRIGRFCSFAAGVRIFTRNHPLKHKSMHPYFFHPSFGYVKSEVVERRQIVVGNDVWVGYNAVVLPQVSRIGDGAVIGAGAVVTKDVPDFAVVAGNPARIIGYRFPEDVRQKIRASRWWDQRMEELEGSLEEFTCDLESEDAANHKN